MASKVLPAKRKGKGGIDIWQIDLRDPDLPPLATPELVEQLYYQEILLTTGFAAYVHDNNVFDISAADLEASMPVGAQLSGTRILRAIRVFGNNYVVLDSQYRISRIGLNGKYLHEGVDYNADYPLYSGILPETRSYLYMFLVNATTPDHPLYPLYAAYYLGGDNEFAFDFKVVL